MNRSTPGLPVHHQLAESTQTQVHCVGDAIQPSHLILCRPLLLPSIFPSIRVFSNESALLIRRSEYWSFSNSPSNEYSGLISFRITNHQRNADQNHNELLPHICKDGYYKKETTRVVSWWWECELVYPLWKMAFNFK